MCPLRVKCWSRRCLTFSNPVLWQIPLHALLGCWKRISKSGHADWKPKPSLAPFTAAQYSASPVLNDTSMRRTPRLQANSSPHQTTADGALPCHRKPCPVGVDHHRHAVLLISLMPELDLLDNPWMCLQIPHQFHQTPCAPLDRSGHVMAEFFDRILNAWSVLIYGNDGATPDKIQASELIVISVCCLQLYSRHRGPVA